MDKQQIEAQMRENGARYIEAVHQYKEALAAVAMATAVMQDLSPQINEHFTTEEQVAIGSEILLASGYDEETVKQNESRFLLERADWVADTTQAA